MQAGLNRLESIVGRLISDPNTSVPPHDQIPLWFPFVMAGPGIPGVAGMPGTLSSAQTTSNHTSDIIEWGVWGEAAPERGGSGERDPP